MQRGASQSGNAPFPTQYEVDSRSTRGSGSSSTQPGQNVRTPLSQSEFQKLLPILTPDFSIDYADRLDKYVVHLQTEDADIAYNDWLNQNPSYLDVLGDSNTVIARQSIEELNEALDYAEKNNKTPAEKAKKDSETLLKVINSLLMLPQLILNTSERPPPSTPNTPIVTPTPREQTNRPTPANSPSPQGGQKYVYYSQCSGPYDSVPLPNGCNVCDAGCGPTTIAMILSSYVDRTLTPPKVIDQLEKNGVRMGCYGSYIAELYSYLSKRGDLKVSSFIIPNEGKLQAKEVADDFRGYIKSGWTIFVLANFRTDGGGHYFWVTEVTDNDEILAYDPYYGRSQPAPFNENKYNPAPYYRYAFAIKKST